jgi:UDP-glucuronate 4-epimerase
VLKASLSVGVKKFVYASSSSVYEASASEVFTETSVLSPPKNLYAFTKWVNEATAKMFFEQKVTKILGLRFFSVYGPWGRPDMAPLRLITSCLTDYKFQLNGDGLVRRDFTFIDDVVLAVVQLIESDNMPEGVLNIGGGNDRSIRELISICEDLTRANLDLQRISSNNSELPKTKANPSKLEDILGVIPETSLEEGIAKTFDWARQPLILGKLKEWVQSV